MKFTSGTRIGPYEIHSLLGSGGMGEVYRARDVRLGRFVALKILPEEASADSQRLSRFEQEARSASMLNHPNIVTIYDIGREGSIAFIAMELVEGKTLRQMLSGKPPSLKELLEISIQVSEGLGCAHSAGIIHRDLKPENIVVSKENRVKILDFGLAKFSRHEIARAEGSQFETLAPETGLGVVLGTVGYMSPEQASARSIDAKSDQFSLGCILYEMAAGKHPFKRRNATETLVAIIRDQPEPIESLNPDMPDPLVSMIRRCLEKNPDQRYSSTTDIARQLRDLHAQLTSAAVLPRKNALRTGHAGKLLVPALLLALFAVVLATVFWYWTSRNAERAKTSALAPSIAVLPFTDLSSATENDYFAEGITEALITELAGVKGMLVIARNSVFQYKGKNVDIKKVGQELNVNYVLEGSVQRSADRIRVHAQLIDVRTGYHLWADRYDRSVADIFAVQDEISRNIVSSLQLKLASSLTEQPTRNLEAYDSYLRGIYFLNRTDTEDLKKAISLLESATSLDPQFAPAHAALGKAYRQYYFFVQPETHWEEKAYVVIEKAIVLDPNLAEAYVARGRLGWTRKNNYPHAQAAKDYQKALELNPNLAEAYGNLGSIYSHVGLIKQAIAEGDRSVKLDPANPQLLGIRVQAYLYDRNYEEVLKQAEHLTDAQATKGLAFLYLGRKSEAEAVIKEVLQREQISPSNPISAVEDLSFIQSAYANALAATGKFDEAELFIQSAIQNDRGLGTYHHTEYNIATAYGLMNKREAALEWLRKTDEHGFSCYPLFAHDPHLNSLRGEPGYQALLRKMKQETERYRKELLHY